MARKPFDPFDPNNRDKRPRRRSEDVLAEKRNWNERMLKVVRQTLENYSWADYIQSVYFLEEVCYSSEFYPIIRRSLNVYMGQLGYVKMLAPTKDGRWRIDGKNTHVYKKIGKPDLELSQLKQEIRED